MSVKITVFKRIKSSMAYFFKMAGVILFWFVTYLMLIYFSDGMFQGTVAALVEVALAALTIQVFIVNYWVNPGAQRYMMIFAFAAFVIFVVHTVIPVASNENPKKATDFTDVPTRYWNLKTGSRIAYYKFDAKPGSIRKRTPIIFLHGGPGAYVRKLDLDFFKSFAEDGYDVYLYDQAGSGRSGLLPKTDYSHYRNVLDFKAIADIINAKQYIVIGQSYGGTLLADLASDSLTSKRIYKAIYAEPGVTVTSSAPVVFAKSPNALTGDVNLPIRVIIGMMVNPKGEFTTQNEVINYLGSRHDLVQKLFLQSFPKTEGGSVPNVEPNVINFSVIGIIPPQITSYNKDLNVKFQHTRVSSMLMLGESSYIERNAPLDLLRINPGIERVQYFKNTGHILWNGIGDNNRRVKASIDAFLNNNAPTLPNFPQREDIPQFIKAGL